VVLKQQRNLLPYVLLPSTTANRSAARDLNSIPLIPTRHVITLIECERKHA